MAEAPLIMAFETFSLISILLAFIIFTRLAIKAPSLGSFRFQLSIFLLVWVVSELPHIADSLGLISVSEYDLFGLTLHAISMSIFALFVGVKSYGFLRAQPPALPAISPIPSGPVRRIGNIEN